MGDYSKNQLEQLTTHIISRDGGKFTQEFFGNSGEYSSLDNVEIHNVLGTVAEPTRTNYIWGGWQDSKGNILVKRECVNGNNPILGDAEGNTDFTYYGEIKDGETYTPIWYDLQDPIISQIDVTNNFSDRQTCTIVASDNGTGISGCYVGKEKPTQELIDNESIVFSSQSTKEISEAGTWYFAVIDKAGNWSYISKQFKSVGIDISQSVVDKDNCSCKITNLLGVVGSTISLSKITTTGYTATSWQYNGEVITSIEIKEESDGDLFPVWGNNRYQLNFNADTGTITTNAKDVIYMQEVGVLPTPTLKGFSFTGWNTKKDGSGTTYTESTIYQNAGDTVLYAQWIGIFSVTETNGSATWSGSSTNGGAKLSISCINPYVVKYGTSANSYTSDSIPKFTNVGTHTVYYKVTADGYSDYTGSFTVKITKASTTLTASSSSGSMTAPTSSTTFSITSNLDISKLSISVSSSNTSIATVSRSGAIITVNYKAVGTASITVKVTDSDNYSGASVSYSITNKAGTISYTASGYSGAYDGNSHAGSLSVSTTGCTVKYGTSSGSYTLSSMPSFSDAGSHIVYYQITKTNYTTVSGSIKVILRKASPMSISSAGTNVDINSGSTMTTYGHKGYESVFNVDGSSVVIGSTSAKLWDVSCTRSVYSNEVGQIVFSFTVSNNSSSTHTIGIATHADIKIGSRDNAPITATNMGFYMTDGSYYFDVYTNNYDGVTNMDGCWFGPYNSRGGYVAWTGKSTGTYSGDSGMCVNWHGRSIPAGATQTYSFIMDMR